MEMPPPPDVAAVQCLLGMTQYLAKFLPHLSDITKPLWDLTQKSVAWVWDQPQQKALETLKEAVASTPILCYYSLEDKETLPCDASVCDSAGSASVQGPNSDCASRTAM